VTTWSQHKLAELEPEWPGFGHALDLAAEDKQSGSSHSRWGILDVLVTCKGGSRMMQMLAGRSFQRVFALSGGHFFGVLPSRVAGGRGDGVNIPADSCAPRGWRNIVRRAHASRNPEHCRHGQLPASRVRPYSAQRACEAADGIVAG
jgi:hypothetical protein